jgi:hypothetical protein
MRSPALYEYNKEDFGARSEPLKQDLHSRVMHYFLNEDDSNETLLGEEND